VLAASFLTPTACRAALSELSCVGNIGLRASISVSCVFRRLWNDSCSTMSGSCFCHDTGALQMSGVLAVLPKISRQPPTDGIRLRATLCKRDGIALIVSNVVGVGILTTPAIIAGLVPDPIAMLALWIVGGALALCGAVSYARLARLWPSAGGEYVYLSRIYGPLAGFLSGWTSLIAGFSGGVAASAAALVVFAGRYFPALASDRTLLTHAFFGIRVSLCLRSVVAAAIIALFAALHICSPRSGKNTQNVLALALTGMIAVFVFAGFASGHGSWSHFDTSQVAFAPKNWLLALIPVMFTYSGWNAAAYVSEEIHASRRSILPILLSGTAIVIALYAALNLVYVYANPVQQMRSSLNVAENAAQVLFGTKSNLVTPMAIIAMLGAISAMTIAGPRVYFAMARDGAFIRAFARTSRRFATPSLAIALQALWSIVLVLFGGFEQILMYTGFAILLSSGAAVAGLLVIEGKKLQAGAGRRRLLAPAIFVLATAAILLDTVWQAPKLALIGLLLVGGGIPIYMASRRANRGQCAVLPEHAGAD